jgi:hypothetical protein
MKKFSIALLVLLGLGYGAWIIFYPTSRVHAKITIEVETPEGVKTGSSVQQVTFSIGPCPLCNTSGPKFRRYLRGEAVAVDLGPRGTLFALLSGGAGGQPTPDPITPVIVEKVFGPKQDNTWRGTDAVRVLGRASGKADVPSELIPFMVRFRDINDPQTVERVDPANLASSFGPGVKLVNATIEITSDPVTTGIAKWLGWLPHFYGKMLDGDRGGSRAGAENQLANDLSSGSFKIPR